MYRLAHFAPCILPLSLFAILSLPWVAPMAEGGRVACFAPKAVEPGP